MPEDIPPELPPAPVSIHPAGLTELPRGMVIVARFPDVQAQEVRLTLVAWQRVYDLIRAPAEYERKTDMPLIKLCRIGSLRSANGSLRSDANVLDLTGVECDYDAGEVSLGDAAMMLAAANISAVLYTSPSHTLDRPRWRILAPLSALRSPELRSLYVARINGALGGILARESFTLSQSFYVGKVRGHDSYDATIVNGECVDAIEGLREWYPTPNSRAPRDGRSMTGMIETATLHEIVRSGEAQHGMGVHDALVSIAARCAGRGMSHEDTLTAMTDLMMTAAWRDSDRWRERFADLERTALSADRFRDASERLPMGPMPAASEDRSSVR